MSQSIPSNTTPQAALGHLTKNHAQGLGFTHTKFDRGWEVANTEHMGLIPTQNRFFVIHTENEIEFALRFKNSEVCSNVL